MENESKRETKAASDSNDGLGGCMLGSEFHACCCTCRYHHEDFHHCTTTKDRGNRCVCSDHKGWICMGLERAHSGWSAHGMCELHEPRGDA